MNAMRAESSRSLYSDEKTNKPRWLAEGFLAKIRALESRSVMKPYEYHASAS